MLPASEGDEWGFGGVVPRNNCCIKTCDFGFYDWKNGIQESQNVKILRGYALSFFENTRRVFLQNQAYFKFIRNFLTKKRVKWNNRCIIG